MQLRQWYIKCIKISRHHRIYSRSIYKINIEKYKHWLIKGELQHICVSKLVIICSDNGLYTGRHQAIIWTNAVIYWLEPKEQTSVK